MRTKCKNHQETSAEKGEASNIHGKSANYQKQYIKSEMQGGRGLKILDQSWFLVCKEMKYLQFLSTCAGRTNLLCHIHEGSRYRTVGKTASKCFVVN